MTDEEYSSFKKFIRVFFDLIDKLELPPEVHPSVVLERMERESPAQVKRGLAMALNDCVEMSIDWSPAAVALFDTQLRDNGAPTLSQLRTRYSRQYRRLLKRGRIRSLAEYYLVKGVVDGCAIEPGAVEFNKLTDMLADYESHIQPPEPP